MSREADFLHNNDSPALPPVFSYCANGLGIHVFTQPGPDSDMARYEGDLCLKAGVESPGYTENLCIQHTFTVTQT